MFWHSERQTVLLVPTVHYHPPLTKAIKTKHRLALDKVQTLLLQEFNLTKKHYVFMHRDNTTYCIYKRVDGSIGHTMARPRVYHDQFYGPIGEKVCLLKLRDTLKIGLLLNTISITEANDYMGKISEFEEGW